MSEIRVVIVEDQHDVALNLFDSLSNSVGIVPVALYGTAEDAVKGFHNDQADIYIVDLGLPGIDGVNFIAAAAKVATDAEFIVHTISENSRDLMDALSAGAVGYIIKGSSEKELVRCIQTVASGGGLISPRMARRLAHHFREIGTQKAVLTKTETEMLNKLKTGNSYEEIADISNVSLSTVQTHIKNIYKKLNVNNRQDAVSTGVLFGMIES